jgi:ComF family protein
VVCPYTQGIGGGIRRLGFPRTVRCAFCSQSESLTIEARSSEASVWRAVVRHLRSWPHVLRSPLDDVGSVLFPASCCVCGNPLSRISRAPVCDDCWSSLEPESGTVCLRCGEDLGVASFGATQVSPFHPADQLCQPCRLAPPPFQRAVAYGGYAGNLRALIHALKYDGMLPVAERLGGLLAEAVLKLDSDTTAPLKDMVVVAVPLHSAKRKQRGFNHAELIAKAAVRALRVQRPALGLRLAEGLLERRRATRSQAGLSPHQRRANLRGVFFAPAPERVAGRAVLLIDDIYTTGATARACSQVLRRAGAATVWVATVARPQREIFSAPQFEELPMQEDVAFWRPDEGVRTLAAVAQSSLVGRNEGRRRVDNREVSKQRVFGGRNVLGQIDEQIYHPRA